MYVGWLGVAEYEVQYLKCELQFEAGRSDLKTNVCLGCEAKRVAAVCPVTTPSTMLIF